ncbi:hypothetical protein HPB50_007970 [Hyalomma asiaticum]|uniref:Uncharacterized protein n=1 Tax=Hyalomma asiaticum TaxID=266040 RepID=A0ACB7TCH6_HYAAI|nr:hypothetical protein HPB50_007970 [Hyalomma asiaticum]
MIIKAKLRYGERAIQLKVDLPLAVTAAAAAGVFPLSSLPLTNSCGRVDIKDARRLPRLVPRGGNGPVTECVPPSESGPHLTSASDRKRGCAPPILAEELVYRGCG